jgi:hypothetical protein
MTGVTVLRGDREQVFTEVTDLHFRALTDKEIQRYIQTGEPMDKAGSYGIQGGAALFCEKMAGDYYNVMGLPVCRLGQVLKECKAMSLSTAYDLVKELIPIVKIIKESGYDGYISVEFEGKEDCLWACKVSLDNAKKLFAEA